MYNLYISLHDIGMCFWTLPALICGALVLIGGVIHVVNDKKRAQDAEDAYKEELNSTEA